VLIDRTGAARVIGFGLSGPVPRDNLEARCYAAPEQATETEEEAEGWGEVYGLVPGRDPTTENGLVRIDVYGLGAILYALLTGRPPFDAVHDASEPVEPSRLNPRIDRNLETICLKCLQKNPRRRYDTAAEVMGDLLRWLNNRPIKVRRIAGWRQMVLWCRRNPRVVAWVTLVLLWVAGPTLVRGCAEFVEARRAWSTVLRPDADDEQYADALHYYEGAYFRRPRDRATQIGLGIARYRTADYAGAVTALRKMKPKYYLDARTEGLAQLFAAMAVLHAGDLAEAQGTLKNRTQILPEPWTRTEATVQAEAEELPKDVSVLVQRLSDPRPRVQRTAVETLGQLGPAAAPAIPALRKRLAPSSPTSDPDEAALRALIKQALGKIETRSGMRPVR
jgi:hypothetical protein